MFRAIVPCGADFIGLHGLLLCVVSRDGSAAVAVVPGEQDRESDQERGSHHAVECRPGAVALCAVVQTDLGAS